MLIQQVVCLSKLFHEPTNIRAGNECVFENWWKCFRYFIQVVWSSKIALNVSEQISSANTAEQVLKTQWTLEAKVDFKHFTSFLADFDSIRTPTSRWSNTSSLVRRIDVICPSTSLFLTFCNDFIRQNTSNILTFAEKVEAT